ncbi:MAG: hypothetical protein ACO2PN_05860 [Pyrobaculum sp.]|jgi:hypothetical protein
MGRVEVLRMPEVRFAGRCWVYVGGAGDYEEEVLVVKVGEWWVRLTTGMRCLWRR